MKHSSPKARLALLTSAVLYSAGAWSMPPETSAIRTEVVKYDPREAATPEGAAALYSRLQRVAARVCDEPTYGATISVRRARQSR